MPKTLGRALTYAGAAAVSLAYLIPMLLVVTTSLKSEAEAQVMSFDLPQVWRFDNYLEVLSTGDVPGAVLNGVVVSVGVTALTILVCALAAFCIARRQTRWTASVYQYLLAGMIAPFAFIPAIKLLQALGLYGTRLGLILVDVGIQIPFITLLFVGFIQRIPRELDEAAVIDGAGNMRLFFQVILPLLRPVSMTSLVLLFTFAWNEFQNVLFLMPDSSTWTMPMTVFDFQGLHSYNYALICANLVVAVLPVLVVYLFAQKHIVKGMTAGSVK